MKFLWIALIALSIILGVSSAVLFVAAGWTQNGHTVSGLLTTGFISMFASMIVGAAAILVYDELD